MIVPRGATWDWSSTGQTGSGSAPFADHIGGDRSPCQTLATGTEWVTNTPNGNNYITLTLNVVLSGRVPNARIRIHSESGMSLWINDGGANVTYDGLAGNPDEVEKCGTYWDADAGITQVYGDVNPTHFRAGTNKIEVRANSFTNRDRRAIDVEIYGDVEPPPVDAGFGLDPVYQLMSEDPVNTATGNFTYQRTDVAIAGRGVGFARAYNALDTRDGPLGPG